MLQETRQIIPTHLISTLTVSSTVDGLHNARINCTEVGSSLAEKDTSIAVINVISQDLSRFIMYTVVINTIYPHIIAEPLYNIIRTCTPEMKIIFPLISTLRMYVWSQLHRDYKLAIVYKLSLNTCISSRPNWKHIWNTVVFWIQRMI